LSSIEPFIFASAVREFWRSRGSQASQQAERGVSDQGTRSEVTGGRQMDGFVRRITELVVAAGVAESSIHTRRRTSELPGYYRPTKGWDIVVVVGGQLLAAIELKSHVGPSFGNNFNNRIEEATGSAVDIWTAYREGALQSSPQPWLGYLLLLEDCPESRRPVSVREPHFAVFGEFRGASYAKRYELFCRKLVRERQYTAACFIMSDRQRADLQDNYTEPAEDLSPGAFLSELIRHVSGR